jgi:heme/copper-type cytochrome/quinol oxidase subunit 2
MRGWIYVHAAEDYKKWAAENLTAEAKPAEASAAAEPAKPAEPKTGGKAKK